MTLQGSCRTYWRMVSATAEDSLSLAETGDRHLKGGKGSPGRGSAREAGGTAAAAACAETEVGGKGYVPKVKEGRYAGPERFEDWELGRDQCWRFLGSLRGHQRSWCPASLQVKAT